MFLLIEHLRRTWRLAALVCIGVFGYQALVTRIYASLAAGQPAMLGRGLPKTIQSLIGIDRLPMNTLGGFLAVACQHPFLLVAALAVPVAIATALLAGEIEKKTIALILARPVSRTAIVVSAAFTCMAWSLLAATASAGGTLAGARILQVAQVPAIETIAAIAGNLLALAAAFTGIALFFSSWCNTRGDAVGWTVTTALVMYVWNFLAQVWPAAKPFAHYSLFHYYSPPRVLLAGPEPWDYQVLGATGLATFVLACLIFRTRDLRV